MDEPVISGLRTRSRAIHDRWERLLHADYVTNPVMAPGPLVAMIPSTMESIFADLAKVAPENALPLTAARTIAWPRFNCGYNPCVNFFKFGERAMLETLVLVQNELNRGDQREAERAVFFSVVRALAAQRARGYCSECESRGSIEGCRYAGTSQQPIADTKS